MITELKENQIFVFGSNANGSHWWWAAYQAKIQFWAEDWIGEWLTGQCYALPTLDEMYNKYSLDIIKENFLKLYKCAENNPDKEFLLTKVWCGIAGYKEEDIILCIPRQTPKNIVMPNERK